MTIWRLWNWLGLTRTAQTAHRLGESLRRALTSEEISALARYNDERYRGVRHSDEWQVTMRALQDRYDASARDASEPPNLRRTNARLAILQALLIPAGGWLLPRVIQLAGYQLTHQDQMLLLCVWLVLIAPMTAVIWYSLVWRD